MIEAIMVKKFKRILSAHNKYQQKGGEDESCRAERDLLRNKGHDVFEYNLHNDEIKNIGKVETVFKTFWSRKTYSEVRSLIRKEKIEIVHVQNFFPLISPSIFYAAHAENVPVVLTLRNYRLICANGIFFRDGKVCESCMTGSPWIPAISGKCYKNSAIGTAVVVGMTRGHKAIGTWRTAVDLFISLTDFAKEKYSQGGIPSNKITVKPNFVYPDPGLGFVDIEKEKYFFFAGRLSKEKGVETLFNAWRQFNTKDYKLVVAGDGELADLIGSSSAKSIGIEYVGHKTTLEITDLMGGAQAVIFPSEWYEGMPRTIIESFAKGTPVIASNLGAMASMITSGINGFHFQSGNASALTDCLRKVVEMGGEMSTLRNNSRLEYINKYTENQNYSKLMECYEVALQNFIQSNIK